MRLMTALDCRASSRRSARRYAAARRAGRRLRRHGLRHPRRRHAVEDLARRAGRARTDRAPSRWPAAARSPARRISRRRRMSATTSSTTGERNWSGSSATGRARPPASTASSPAALPSFTWARHASRPAVLAGLAVALSDAPSAGVALALLLALLPASEIAVGLVNWAMACCRRAFCPSASCARAAARLPDDGGRADPAHRRRRPARPTRATGDRPGSPTLTHACTLRCSATIPTRAPAAEMPRRQRPVGGDRGIRALNALRRGSEARFYLFHRERR